MKYITLIISSIILSSNIFAKDKFWGPSSVKLESNLSECIESIQKGFVIEDYQTQGDLRLIRSIYNEKFFWIRVNNLHNTIACEVSEYTELDESDLLSRERTIGI